MELLPFYSKITIWEINPSNKQIFINFFVPNGHEIPYCIIKGVKQTCTASPRPQKQQNEKLIVCSC